MSLLMRNYTVTPASAAASCRASTGSRRRPGSGQARRLVLLRQRGRGEQGRGRHERPPGRSHLVGSPRLEPDRPRPRGRRVVPRAVPQRHRQASGCPCGSNAPSSPVTPAGPSPSSLRALHDPRGDRRGRHRRRRGQTLRVLVGPWVQVAGDLDARSIAAGPRTSGVYARFSADGRTLTLLDQDGPRRARTFGRRGPRRGHPPR
jgi:hypothetical protein